MSSLVVRRLSVDKRLLALLCTHVKSTLPHNVWVVLNVCPVKMIDINKIKSSDWGQPLKKEKKMFLKFQHFFQIQTIMPVWPFQQVKPWMDLKAMATRRTSTASRRVTNITLMPCRSVQQNSFNVTSLRRKHDLSDEKISLAFCMESEKHLKTDNLWKQLMCVLRHSKIPKWISMRRVKTFWKSG